MTTRSVNLTLQRAGIFADRFSQKDGVFSFKRSYFYHLGQSPELYAEKIKTALPQARILEAFDKHANWPRTSYMIVTFSLN